MDLLQTLAVGGVPLLAVVVFLCKIISGVRGDMARDPAGIEYKGRK